ncbi:MAG: gamma carboxymuconolactone decarboxylase [Alphaproteobacteria bacterium]|nr:gamma carboxymuconolactone decarboxylase [Alphaproteobacteria bacterium]
MTVTNEKLHKDGMAVRREVLGAQWVDPQIEKAMTDDFTAAIQDMVTEYCWGYGWARGADVLDRKTRSLMNLCILTALGKMNELKGHTRGALQNGCTVEEIKEALIHATIYCGIPAGVDAFRNAKEAIDAWDGKK